LRLCFALTLSGAKVLPVNKVTDIRRLVPDFAPVVQAAEKSGNLSFRAPSLREESLLVFCFQSGGILRFAQNDNQSTNSATCVAGFSSMRATTPCKRLRPSRPIPATLRFQNQTPRSALTGRRRARMARTSTA
jgi:hypothetical protein